MRNFEVKKQKLRLAAACALMAALCSAGPLSAMDPAFPNGEENDTYVAVLAGRIITVSGEEIENGVIVIRNGKIEAVGKKVEYPRSAEVIHAENLTVMPGLVHPATTLGMGRFRRSGVNANLKAADEFTLDPKVHGELLKLGFTTLGLLPQGSGIPGQAYAFQPEGRGKADWTLNDAAYLLVTFTSAASEKSMLKKALETAKKEIEKVEKARKDWEEKQKKAAEEKKKAEAEKKKAEPEKKKEGGEGGKAPGAGGDEPEKKPPEKGKEEKKEETFKPPPINPVYQPIVDLIQKKENVRAMVRLGGASDRLHFNEAVKNFKELAWVYQLGGGRSGGGRFGRGGGSSGGNFYLALEEFSKEKAKVILGSTITYKPMTRNRINLPATFARAGCEVSLVPGNDSVSGCAAYLAEVAALIKGGMDRADALRAVTLHPARILGLGDRVGSLEKGKDANLLFLTNDPFNAMTRVEKVMIQGKIAAEGRAIQ